MTTEHTLPLLGSAAFGILIGWFVYYINRYRKGDVQFSDLTTLIGIIGGGSVMTLFESKTPGLTKEEMFGAYGIGLFLGFFSYFALLLILVKNSGGVFTWTWFLDGRRKNPRKEDGEDYPGGAQPPEQRPMADRVAIMEDRLNRLAWPPPGQEPAVLAGDTPAAFATSEETPVVMDTVNPKAARILASCEDKWESNKADCNAFAKAVAASVGVAGLDGDANHITDIITGPGWRQIADGAAAKAAADSGEFVLGGLRGNEQAQPSTHGHVVVVVTGGLAQGKYPTAYWGRLGGSGEKNKTLNYAWRQGDRDKVHYASKTIA